MNKLAIEKVQLIADAARASVDSCGGQLTSLAFEDRSVLVPLSTPATSSWTHGGMPLLFPCAGRCWDRDQNLNHLSWQGATYPMPLHGVAWQRRWTLQRIGQNEACAKLQLQDPFFVDLEVRYKLHAQDLRIQLTVQNRSPVAVPMSPGWHPYFVGDLRSIAAPIQNGYRVTAEGRAGDLVSAIESPLSKQSNLFENGILELQAMPTCTSIRINLTDISWQLMWPQDHFRYLVLWRGPTGSCVEPWYGLPDAITTATHFTLAPQASHTWTLVISV